eukprot:s1_g1152.t1
MIAAMFRRWRNAVYAAGCLAGLSACAALPEGDDQIAQCRFLIDRVDQRVADRQVGDAEAEAIDGFPYLRINRLLASFKTEVSDEAAFGDWVARLRALDRTGRQVELQNLGAANIFVTVDVCADRLLAEDLKGAGFKPRLLAAAQAPRHYNDWVRAAGLYPLSHIGVALGFDRWKADNLPAFSQYPEIWRDGETRYTLSVQSELFESDVAALIDLSAQNALNIPDLSGSVLAEMAALYAPVFAVEEASDADKVGRPFLAGSTGVPTTDADDPTVYVRLAHTRMDGEVLPQLVYTIWFPERPKEGAFDILGGPLDGLVWRVTLDRQGRPLVYDSIHSCGCYHLFFPTELVRRVRVAEDSDLREEPLTPKQMPALEAGERYVLHITSGSHYLRNISTTDTWTHAKALRIVDEHAAPAFGLRSLDIGGGARQSLFRPDGVVSGTERTERFILWPMGISSPGAMRQWGTHATAFVGARHADDPAGLVHADLVAARKDRLKFIEQAEEDARAAVAAAPDLAEGHLQLAVALGFKARLEGSLTAHAEGYADEARAHLEYVAAREPDNPWMLALLGGWHLEISDAGGFLGRSIYGAEVDAGLDAYDQALALMPDDLVIIYQCALQLAALGDDEYTVKAVALLQDAQLPEQPDALAVN